MPKDGVSRGRQAYACGDCKHRHIPSGEFRRFSDAEKDMAIAMRVDGSSLSAIARTIGASLTAVRAWVEKRGPARLGAGGNESGGVQPGANVEMLELSLALAFERMVNHIIPALA